jgi:hypothetical protein
MEREGFAGEKLSADTWLTVIASRVPSKFVELNRRAFNDGRRVVTPPSRSS